MYLCTLTLRIRDFYVMGSAVREKSLDMGQLCHWHYSGVGVFPIISSGLREMSEQTGWGLGREFSVLRSKI